MDSTEIFFAIFNDKKIIKIYLNDKEILEEKSLLSLGLKDNFEVELEKLKDNEYKLIIYNN